MNHPALPATAKADCFKDTYRTQDGELQIDFVCERNAGSADWSVWAKYGDVRITHQPSEFFNSGLKFTALSRDDLLKKLSLWAEAVWSVLQSQVTPPATGGVNVRA